MRYALKRSARQVKCSSNLSGAPQTQWSSIIFAMQEKNLLTIKQVSRRLNIPKPTLRFWEKELDGIIVPLRNNGGQRHYTPENIAIIEEIKKLRKKD